MLDNPISSSREISLMLMKDQAMVARILKLSNSALYTKPQEITNLANAVTYLGTQTLRNIILQIAMVRMFPFDKKDIPQFSAVTFWEHSLGTAYFTNTLEKKLNLPVSEDYYIGGLLHDLGKLMIYQFYPGKFREIIRRQVQENVACAEAEEEVLGVNHADIGEYLAQQWQFKPTVVAAIRDHHKILASSAASLGEQPVHAAVVRIANMFAKAAGLCFPWDKRVFDIVGDPSWEVLKTHADGQVDVERLTFEIRDEAENIKASVKELLSNKKQRMEA
jgi:putative nucleotidyltransferase with HDIG domain